MDANVTRRQDDPGLTAEEVAVWMDLAPTQSWHAYRQEREARADVPAEVAELDRLWIVACQYVATEVNAVTDALSGRAPYNPKLGQTAVLALRTAVMMSDMVFGAAFFTRSTEHLDDLVDLLERDAYKLADKIMTRP